MPYKLHHPGTWNIQDIRPQATPFALLALLPSYDIDTELLERHYLIMQKELHPDRFVNKSPQEIETAEMMSAWVNRAYTTLKDPVLRAKSLLKIKGCVVDEGKVLQDAVLLEEALEWRQKLEDLESTKQQEQFKVDLQNAIKSCEHDFSQAWDQQDQQTLQQAYLRLSYLMKTLKTYLHKINSQAQQSLLKKLKSASSNI